MLLYTLDKDSGTYHYRSYKYGKDSVELNRSGEFSIPIKHEITSKSLYIVIYRELDSSRLIGDTFPNDITQIPSLSMEEFRVYSKKVVL